MNAQFAACVSIGSRRASCASSVRLSPSSRITTFPPLENEKVLAKSIIVSLTIPIPRSINALIRRTSVFTASHRIAATVVLPIPAGPLKSKGRNLSFCDDALEPESQSGR